MVPEIVEANVLVIILLHSMYIMIQELGGNCNSILLDVIGPMSNLTEENTFFRSSYVCSR